MLLFISEKAETGFSPTFQVGEKPVFLCLFQDIDNSEIIADIQHKKQQFRLQVFTVHNIMLYKNGEFDMLKNNHPHGHYCKICGQY